MKKLMLFLFLVTPLLMTSSLHAVCYPFPKSKPAYLGVETAGATGARVYLFHSGASELNNAINVNDILVVYREYPHGFESAATGKVKVISSFGRNYYEAEVIEGTITPGELARKGAIACFITAFRKIG